MKKQSSPSPCGCFVVDGNIGAGKSTFLQLIQQYLPVHVIYEPHTKWQQVISGENLLEKFYRDTPRWGYTFQTYAFVTRVMEQEEHARRFSSIPVHILERSVFSDRYCFAAACHELGNMSRLEWKLYCEWFAWLVDQYVTLPKGFIYLQTDPQVCHQRLLKRNRQEESGVSIEYLSHLHEKHEAWLVRKEGLSDSVKNIPVLVLDCNEDFEHNKAQLQKHIESIVNFVGQYYTDNLRDFSQSMTL